LEAAAEDVKDKSSLGTSRLVILAPVNAEVYVNDERKGSVGSSGRLVLSTVPAGQHVLRVSKPGEKDDERVIEVREGADEQVIQAHLKLFRENRSLPTTSQSGIGSHLQSSVMPGIVACTSCGARFAEGVKFCGRCGNRNFTPVSETLDKLMFQCPRCSTNLLRNTKFCGRCGLSIKQISNASPKVSFSNPIDMAPLEINPNEKNCGNCGLKSPLNVMFCGRCGKNIS
jgi:NADH pyrophosphatase NudC (nudix superfamily)